MNFEEIYEQYRDRIFRLCMGYVNDPDIASDIVQDTFIIVWQELPRFRQEAAISTWIYRIASNQCLRQVQQRNKYQPERLNEVAEQDAELSSKTEYEKSKEIEFLYSCISSLPEIDRLIISLELEDCPQNQIAEIVGITGQNVRVRIHRIKQLLAKKFSEHGF